MAKIQVHFRILYGLAGGYMPTSNYVATFSSRSYLAAMVRDELENCGMPVSLFREIGIARKWRFIQTAKSASSVAFSVEHKGMSLEFHGLTDDEYNAESAGEEW